MKLSNLVPQFKKYCLYEKGMTAYNCKAIIRNMKMLMSFAETENISKINENIIRTFLFDYSKQRDWSPKTFRTYLQNFSTFFKWCVVARIITKNPTENIEKPKLPKRLPRSLSKEQVIKILSHTTWYPWRYNIERLRNETIIATFLFTGLRLQELINLKVFDVNMDNEEIMVYEGKGRKDRIIPIHPRLIILFRAYFREMKKNNKKAIWLFTGIHSDKKLGSKNVQQVCRKISASSGIKFTPHILRHTFARLSIDADLNLFKLKEIMGHSDVSTTQIYLSVSKEGIKRSFKKLELI